MSDDEAPTATGLSTQVGDEIRVWMTRRRMTGERLAQLLKVSPAWVSYRINGKQEIGLDDLDRIATALDVDVLDLFPAEVAEPTPVTSVEPRVVATAGKRRSGRRLTGSYPASGAGTSPVRPAAHTASATRRPRHSPDRPPTRTDRERVDRPVRLDQPDTRKRPRRSPGDDVL